MLRLEREEVRKILEKAVGDRDRFLAEKEALELQLTSLTEQHVESVNDRELL